MKFNLSITVMLSILFLASNLQAQDIIHMKKKNEKIEVKVLEIGTSEIKYKKWEEKEEGVTYSVDRTAVYSIKFENGRTEYFGDETIDREEFFAGQKKRAIKISFIEPMIASTTLSYEQSLKPGHSLEFRGTIVGLGFNNDNFRSAGGFIGAASYRLYTKPSFLTTDLRRAHVLQGWYIKPELFLGSTSYDNYIFLSGSNDTRVSSTTGGFLLNFGKQWVAGDVFVVDIHSGIGYGGGTSNHGYIVIENNIAFSFGLDIGIAF